MIPLLDSIDEHAFHRRHVVDHAGDDIAGSARVVPAQRKTLERGVEIAPQVENDLLLEGYC